jgi:hypothetical protein
MEQRMGRVTHQARGRWARRARTPSRESPSVPNHHLEVVVVVDRRADVAVVAQELLERHLQRTVRRYGDDPTQTQTRLVTNTQGHKYDHLHKSNAQHSNETE